MKLTEVSRARASRTVEEVRHSEQYEPYYFWRRRPWGKRFNLNPNPCAHGHPTFCIDVEKLEYHRDQIARERKLKERSLKRRCSRNKNDLPSNAARNLVQEVPIQKKMFLERNVRICKRDLNIYKHYMDQFLAAQRAELMKEKQNRVADIMNSQRRPAVVYKDLPVLNLTSIVLPDSTYQHYNVGRDNTGRNTRQELNSSVGTPESPPDTLTNERLRPIGEPYEVTPSPEMKRCLMLALLCQTQKNFTEKEADCVSTLCSEVGFSPPRTRIPNEESASSVLSTFAASSILTAMAFSFKPCKSLPQTVMHLNDAILSSGEPHSRVSDADVLKNWFSTLEPQKLSHDQIKSLHLSVRERIEKLLADWYRSIHDCDLDAESYYERAHQPSDDVDIVNVIVAWNNEVDKVLIEQHTETEIVPRLNDIKIQPPQHSNVACNSVNAEVRRNLESDRSRSFAWNRDENEIDYNDNQAADDHNNHSPLHSYTSMSSVNHHTLQRTKRNSNAAADGVFKVPPPPPPNLVWCSRAPKASTKTRGRDAALSSRLQQPSLINNTNHASEVRRRSFNSTESSFGRETSVSEQDTLHNAQVPGLVNNRNNLVPKRAKTELLLDSKIENSSYNREEAAPLYITKDVRSSSRNVVKVSANACRSIDADFVRTKIVKHGKQDMLRQRLRFDDSNSDDEAPNNDDAMFSITSERGRNSRHRRKQQPIREEEEEIRQPITEYSSSPHDSDSDGINFSMGGASVLVTPLRRSMRKRRRVFDDSVVHLKDMYRVMSASKQRPHKSARKDAVKKKHSSAKENTGNGKKSAFAKETKRKSRDTDNPRNDHISKARMKKSFQKKRDVVFDEAATTSRPLKFVNSLQKSKLLGEKRALQKQCASFAASVLEHSDSRNELNFKNRQRIYDFGSVSSLQELELNKRNRPEPILSPESKRRKFVQSDQCSHTNRHDIAN